MKFRYCLATLICATAMLLQTKSADAAFSTVSVNDKVYLDGGLAGSNGEFTVRTSPGGAYLFDTFCVEHSYQLNLNTAYYVSSIEPFSDGPPQNPLTAKAAALYGAFAAQRNAQAGPTQTGTYSLLGENYNQNNTDSNALQDAIWYFQGQIALAIPNNNKYVKAANLAAAAAINLALRGVKIMNLSTSQTAANGSNPGVLKQSQMYWEDPGPLVDVPEPSSLVLFAIGLVGAGWSHRRRSAISKSA